MKILKPASRAFLLRSAALCSITLGALSLRAQGLQDSYEWDIELLTMDLNADAIMPLGPGWGDIKTHIHVSESAALESNGKAFAFRGSPEALVTGPGQGNGNQYFVNSFFDVFFDITVTDIDPTVNFGGGPTDGLAMPFLNNGPARMQNFYFATADPNAPNLGLIPPPESSPYIGHFNIEIPLGADLNGNGENDKIKFTLVAHTVGGENRTFITLPNGTVIDSFDSTADLSGAVVDESQDPPFSISLTGPTTASSRLLGVPDGGATWILLGGVFLMMGAVSRRLRS